MQIRKGTCTIGFRKTHHRTVHGFTTKGNVPIYNACGADLQQLPHHRAKEPLQRSQPRRAVALLKPGDKLRQAVEGVRVKIRRQQGP